MARPHTSASNQRCTATTATGARCRMRPLHGSRLCFAHSHSPQVAAKRTAARRKGGQATRTVPDATAPVPLASVPDIRRRLEWAMAHLDRHENTVRRSLAMARIAESAARLHELHETERRLDAIEERLRMLEASGVL